MQQVEPFVTSVQSFVESRATFSESAVEEIGQIALRERVFVDDQLMEMFAYRFFGYKLTIAFHDPQIGAFDTGFDIIKYVAKEGPDLGAGFEFGIVLRFIGLQRFKGSPDSVPAGHVESGLVPAEHPRNRSKVCQAWTAASTGRARANTTVLKGVDGCGASVECEEIVFQKKSSIGLGALFRQEFDCFSKFLVREIVGTRELRSDGSGNQEFQAAGCG